MPKKINKKKAEQKIQDALNILHALGLPRQQLNDRSALTILSLLALEPETAWVDASDPLMGITPMMDFFYRALREKICTEHPRDSTSSNCSSISPSRVDSC